MRTLSLRISRIAAGATAAAVVCATAAPASAAGSGFTPPARLDAPGRTANAATQRAPSLAVSPSGPVVAFLDDRDIRNTARYAWRDGAVWHEGTMPATAAPDWAQGTPTLAADRAGSVWSFRPDGSGGLATHEWRGEGRWRAGPAFSPDSGFAVRATASGDSAIALLGVDGLWSCVTAIASPIYETRENTPASGFSGGYDKPLDPFPARVVVFDTRTRTFSAETRPFGDRETITSVALAYDSEGTLWAAAAHDSEVLLATLAPGSSRWVDVQAPVGLANAVAIAVLSGGEVVVAGAGQRTRAWVRSSVTGKWGDAVDLGPRATSLSAVATRGDVAHVLDVPLPFEDAGGATLVWGMIGATLSVTYTADPTGLLPGTWSEPHRLERSSHISLAESAGRAALAYDHASDDSRDVWVAEQNEAGVWGAPEIPHADTTIAADKWINTVVERESGFDVLWLDEQGVEGHGAATLRRAPATGGSSSTPDLPRWASVVASPNGSLAAQWSDVNTLRVRIDDPSGATAAETVVEGYGWLEATPVSAGGFAFARLDSDTTEVMVYADGRFGAMRPVPVEGTAWARSLTGAGAGAAWITWVEAELPRAPEPEEGLEYAVPLPAPAPPAPVPYRIRGARVDATSMRTVTIAEGTAEYPPSVHVAGDGAGGIALLWVDPDGATRFATPGAPPVALDRPESTWGVSLAATPRGDAIVAWLSDGEVLATRRVEGGPFRAVAPFRIEDLYGGFQGAGYGCYLDAVVALFAPPLAFDGDGTVLTTYSDGDRTMLRALPIDAGAWGAPMAAGPESWWAATRTTLGGDAAVAWVSGDYADRRVQASVLDRAALASRLSAVRDGGEVVATLATARGAALEGRDLSFRFGGQRSHAVTDERGQARVAIPQDATAVGVDFAGDRNFDPSSAHADLTAPGGTATLVGYQGVAGPARDFDGRPISRPRAPGSGDRLGLALVIASAASSLVSRWRSRRRFAPPTPL